MAPARDQQLSWSFQPVLTLGGSDDGPEAFYRVGATTVGVDASARVYVLDRAVSRVVVFDSAGVFLRSMGSPGRGPGELQLPTTINVHPDGSVDIFDASKRSLVRFGPDGTVLPDRPFPPLGLLSGQHRLFGSGSSGFVAATNRILSQQDWAYTLLHIHGEDSIPLATVPMSLPAMVRYPSCGGALNLPMLFLPDMSWDGSADRLAVNSVPEYVVNIFEGDRLAQSLRRPIHPTPATRELAVRELGDGLTIDFGQGPCTIDPGEMVDLRGFAPEVPVIRTVRTSPEGEVWVQRRLSGSIEDGPIDVFEATGEYLGTLDAGTPMPLALLSGNRALLRDTDSQDVQRLTIARLIRLEMHDSIPQN